MKEVKIKSESYAQRCEICHKTDLFDPIKNYCSRCENPEQNLTKVDAKTDCSVLQKQARSIFPRVLSFVLALPLNILALYLFVQLIYADFREFESTPIRVFSKITWPALTVFYISVRLLMFAIISNRYQLGKITKVFSKIFLLPMCFVTANVIYPLLWFVLPVPSLGGILFLSIFILPLLLVFIGAFYERKI